MYNWCWNSHFLARNPFGILYSDMGSKSTTRQQQPCLESAALSTVARNTFPLTDRKYICQCLRIRFIDWTDGVSASPSCSCWHILCFIRYERRRSIALGNCGMWGNRRRICPSREAPAAITSSGPWIKLIHYCKLLEIVAVSASSPDRANKFVDEQGLQEATAYGDYHSLYENTNVGLWLFTYPHFHPRLS